MSDVSDKNLKAALTTGPARTFPAINLENDAILLDIDGTLLDIAPTPDDVHVPAALRRSLVRLVSSTGGALALISGRTLESVDALFAPLITAAVGCHGAQLRAKPESPTELPVPPLSEAIRQAFSDVTLLQPGVRVEDKHFTLAFHCRLAPDREEPLFELLRARLAPFVSEYTLMRGKFIFEIKPRNCTKGEALRVLMRRAPFAGRRPVFFGDDTTDEYAFAALHQFGGIGVSVGQRMPNASYMVDTPRNIRHWLDRLAHEGKTDG
jgi:trehalose 6-phosphate phosphatase